MPYTVPPVDGAQTLPYQDETGYDATAEGQQDVAEQSGPEHVYDATPNVQGPGGRWLKSIDGGAANWRNGQPTGAGWMPDGTSDGSKWKGV